MNVGFDLTHELNDFNQPKLTSEIELIRNVVMFIMFTDPGQYPSLPMIGMKIENYLYMDYDDISTEDIKDELITQCGALGYYFEEGMLRVVKQFNNGRPELYVQINGRSEYPKGYITNANPDSSYIIGVTYDQYKNLLLAVQ